MFTYGAANMAERRAQSNGAAANVSLIYMRICVLSPKVARNALARCEQASERAVGGAPVAAAGFVGGRRLSVVANKSG